jgi:hypothetical protein
MMNMNRVWLDNALPTTVPRVWERVGLAIRVGEPVDSGMGVFGAMKATPPCEP